MLLIFAVLSVRWYRRVFRNDEGDWDGWCEWDIPRPSPPEKEEGGFCAQGYDRGSAQLLASEELSVDYRIGYDPGSEEGDYTPEACWSPRLLEGIERKKDETTKMIKKVDFEIGKRLFRCICCGRTVRENYTPGEFKSPTCFECRNKWKLFPTAHDRETK